MSFFAAATAWLSQNIGQEPPRRHHSQAVDKRGVPIDSIVSDFHLMQDAETRAKNGGSSSRGGGRNNNSRRNNNSLGGMYIHHNPRHQQQRPLPKSVVHKDPVRGKKKKEKVKSNRLGKSYMV